MANRKNSKKDENVESLKFIAASNLGFSDEGWENINSSSNITFGDANRTMYSLSRLNDRVTFDDDDDQAILDAAIEKYGPDFYVDLES